MQKMRQGDYFQTSFPFFKKKALFELQASAPQLILNILRQLATEHTIKTNYTKL